MIRTIKFWLIKYRLHILVWAIFIFYEDVVTYLIVGPNGSPMYYATHYILIFFLFYIQADIVFPYALRNKKNAPWLMTIGILSELGVYLMIAFALDVVLDKYHFLPNDKPMSFNFQYAIRNSYRCFYFMMYSTGYYFLKTYNQEKRKREELEKQRLNEIILRQKAEQELIIAHNAFLKAQINPHFLFNTLDFIYYQVTEVSPVAADAIIALADMMRYAIDSDKAGEFIHMGEEMHQVINLIYLNQIRKNGDFNLEFICPDEIRDLHFIPLVLLTLTENIFKHGNLSNQNKASLKIDILEDLLVIESDNVSSRSNSTKSTGNGLKNIETRLNYAYGDAATFAHHLDNEGRFKLTITVPVRLLHGNVLPSAISAGTGIA